MMSTLPMPAFRFDAVQHRYFCNGKEREHCTGLLQKAGLIDDTWFTEESSIRGSAIHRLTADYDLDALDPRTLVSTYRGYVLGHVDAMRVIPHEWDKVEQPIMHPVHLYGVRTDRVGRIYGLQGVLEGKSTAAPHYSHEIQTALQVLAESYGHPIPPEAWWRGALYWKPNGKWRLIQHINRRDFDVAREILNTFCPPESVAPPMPTVRATRGGKPVADRRRHDRNIPPIGDRRPAAGRASGRARVV